MDTSGVVTAVSRSSEHSFSKPTQREIHLVAGLGVMGDAHQGTTVKHRSRVARNPDQPNLRQVHLIHGELLDELAHAGYLIAAGELGENVTTRGVDLLSLPAGARLHIGDSAVVEVTGLRNPCVQIEQFQAGLLKECVERRADGRTIRKTGVMSIVLASGDVRPGDVIRVELPDEPHAPLDVV